MATIKKLIKIRVSLLRKANIALRKNPRLKKVRRVRTLSGQALAKLLPKKKVDKVDKIINARFKGVRFVKIRGRIVPIKPKRRK